MYVFDTNVFVAALRYRHTGKMLVPRGPSFLILKAIRQGLIVGGVLANELLSFTIT